MSRFKKFEVKPDLFHFIEYPEIWTSDESGIIISGANGMWDELFYEVLYIRGQSASIIKKVITAGYVETNSVIALNAAALQRDISKFKPVDRDYNCQLIKRGHTCQLTIWDNHVNSEFVKVGENSIAKRISKTLGRFVVSKIPYSNLFKN